MSIKIGDLVKHRITGFEGVVVAYCVYAHNADTVAVKSRALKDGAPIENQWFDANQVELLESGVVPADPTGEMSFDMGDVVRDCLTEYQGSVIGYTRWISGCIRVGIQSREMVKGVPVQDQWLPMSQLDLVAGVGKNEKAFYESKPGGPMRAQVERSVPR